MSLRRILEGPRFRQVAKVVVAALLAYGLSSWTGRDYALFGALGAAMVVGGSVGEDLKASLNRVRGTLAGTAVGVVLAHAIGTSIWSLGLAVAAVASLSIGTGWGAPPMRVGLAMALVVLFTHTSDPAHYGLLRALNTLIGVAVGLAVSRFVWPIRGRAEIAVAIDRSLVATAATLDELASGAAQDALLPRQVQVLDALAAIRTARKNASVERRLHGDADLLSAPVRWAARASVSALSASLKLESLVQTGASGECLQTVRQAIASLASFAKDAATPADPASEFAVRYGRAERAAAAPDLEPEARGLLAGLLADLQQVAVALEALREERRRDGAGEPSAQTGAQATGRPTA
jgi:uncharacterized membrane protein YccC